MWLEIRYNALAIAAEDPPNGLYPWGQIPPFRRSAGQEKAWISGGADGVALAPLGFFLRQAPEAIARVREISKSPWPSGPTDVGRPTRLISQIARPSGKFHPEPASAPRYWPTGRLRSPQDGSSA